MSQIRIRKGLNVTLSGAAPDAAPTDFLPRRVALVAADFPGLKPKMRVQVGETVLRGQPLLEDRAAPGVLHVAPAAGTVVAIHRGERRVLQSVVIELSSEESLADGPTVPLSASRQGSPSREAVQAALLESGQWTALRARPFGRVPSPQSSPFALFVTAIDTQPLAPPMARVLEGREADFERGLEAVSTLAERTFVCAPPGLSLPMGSSKAQLVVFDGPHPAGNAGTHIHHLAPVHRDRTAWYLGAQDVAAIGRLWRTGQLDFTRVISFAGPSVATPRLVRTRLGVSLDELRHGALVPGSHRVLSGSALAGRIASGEVHGFLSRYHQQVSVVPEGGDRPFLGWLRPQRKGFSTLPIYLIGLASRRPLPLTTDTHGSPRAMVPIGLYERVLPMDMMPTHLLRALAVGDVEEAEKLGCLELEEEDLALCSFVCPGKQNWGVLLRQALRKLESEG